MRLLLLFSKFLAVIIFPLLQVKITLFVMHVNKANTINYLILGLAVYPLGLCNSFFQMFGALLLFQLVNIIIM
jgi:hypothetical protein